MEVQFIQYRGTEGSTFLTLLRPVVNYCKGGFQYAADSPFMQSGKHIRRHPRPLSILQPVSYATG